MSSIDEIIARSRQPGAFKEVRRFTVARAEAMQKMRKFALANPDYYILELIQAAIANGAAYLDIAANQTSVRFSYYGGGFKKDDLEELFEFLFAAKSDVDLADVRQLALGINAVIAAQPTEIVIESGMGTLESTHRIVISRGGEQVEVGTPTQALNGTYIRVSGMDRKRLNEHGSQNEHAVLMERCLMAPIPILFNNDPIFGTASVRNPTLFGFTKRLAVNEEDLYGTIGVPETLNMAHFRIVTYGVWIQSLTYEHQGVRLGGVISCDSLRKSADHSSIVQDDMLGEMWFRLTPYFEQLRTGRRVSNKLDVQDLQGERLGLPELREALRDGTRAVIASNRPAGKELEHVIRMSEGINAPVFVAGGDDLTTFRQLFPHIAVIVPRYSPTELELFSKPNWSPPPHPWLAQDVELAVVDSSASALEPFPELLESLGDEVIVVRAYFPAGDVISNVGVPCEVVMANRLIWSGSIDSDFSGFHLCVDVPVPAANVSSPSSSGDKTSLNTNLYGADPGQVDPLKLVLHLQQILREPLEFACASVAATLGPDGTSVSARHLVLGVLQGKLVSELTTDLQIELRLMDRSVAPSLLHSKVFETLTGGLRSVSDLSAQLSQRGVVYGVLDAVEPDLTGLDPTDVLRLNEWEEMALIQIIGAASYVRIDRRETLARLETLVVRDWAEGLRSYSDEGLLIEGGTPVFSQRDQLALQLLKLWRDREADTENRRQAHRHLVHYVMALVRQEQPIPEPFGDEPLFPALDGLVSLNQVLQAAPVTMMDGWPSDLASQHVTQTQSAPSAAKIVLKMHPFLARYLRDTQLLGARGFAKGHSVTPSEMSVRHFISDQGVEGEIGLVPGGGGDLQVLVMQTREVFYLGDLAREFGIGGVIRVEELSASGLVELKGWLYEESMNFLGQLFKQVLSGMVDGERYDLILVTLLDFMAHHLLLVQEPSGLKIRCTNSVANQILSLPIVAAQIGVVTPLQVIQDFLVAVAVGEASRWEAPWTARTHPSVIAAMAEICQPERILRPPSRGATARLLDFSKPLLDWLNKMMVQLSVAKRPIRVVLFQNRSNSLCEHYYGENEITLRMSPNHPMVKNVIDGQLDRTLLLLALYASAASYFPEISMEDEIVFQAGLADLLMR